MKRIIFMSIAFLGTILFFGGQFDQVQAVGTQEGGAEIDLKRFKEKHSVIRDPENPEVQVDPGETPQTEGDLRIDFVPKLNFSTVTIADKALILPVNAQLFHGNTNARGNFVQVSDYRDNSTGWTLQVRQEQQFKHATKPGAELKGAVISLDQTWTNSTKDASLSPIVSKEVIHMSNVGDTYNLAQAQPEKGSGTWSIIFGASKENKNDRQNSLEPRLDASGNAIEDPIFKKPVYSNQAITLSVPKETEKEAGAYSTVLTWILAELP
ncbi:WxL domain-containing protein [Enterococcus rotai]|uniref:WxL domain-containing protein n=1 Tax=Enterococcus rotai TaxID=118060 RepID=UPI0035C75408